MTNRPEHAARATPPLRRTRQVALAASMALVAVSGTATIAWSALSLAFGPGLSAAEAPEPAQPLRTADTEGFADATRDQAARAAASPEPHVVVLSTQSSEAQRLGNAVQPKLFGGGTAPAATSAARAAPVPQPDTAGDDGTLRPIARPGAATPEPVMVAGTAPQTRTAPVSRARVTPAEDISRLHALWNTGLFR